MMKSKLMAVILASVLSLVAVVIIAIVMVGVFDMEAGNDRFTKMIAFGVIGIWLGLFAWLKPKAVDPNKDNAEKQ